VTSQRAGAPAAVGADGRQDFDFLFGEWRIMNRKLKDPLARKPARWLDFEAIAEARPILGGLGNIDTYSSPDFPVRGGFHRFALRLFDPGANLWSICWTSTLGRGQLDPPVVGRFRNGAGRFEGDDIVGGRAIKVRIDWNNITPLSARWEQSFSFNNGETYETNWIMDWMRIA